MYASLKRPLNVRKCFNVLNKKLMIYTYLYTCTVGQKNIRLLISKQQIEVDNIHDDCTCFISVR